MKDKIILKQQFAQFIFLKADNLKKKKKENLKQKHEKNSKVFNELIP